MHAVLLAVDCPRALLQLFHCAAAAAPRAVNAGVQRIVACACGLGNCRIHWVRKAKRI